MRISGASSPAPRAGSPSPEAEPSETSFGRARARSSGAPGLAAAGPHRDGRTGYVLRLAAALRLGPCLIASAATPVASCRGAGLAPRGGGIDGGRPPRPAPWVLGRAGLSRGVGD